MGWSGSRVVVMSGSRVTRRFLLVGVFGLVMLMGGYGSLVHTPPLYELGHLPAGICHWEYGRYELYRVNPPLARMVATLPLVLLGEYGPERDWSNYQLDPLSRETVPMGIRFFKANGERALLWFRIARVAGLAFVLLGAWGCYAWARDLWDARAGLAAAVLWSIQPMVWGWGAFVMPDVPAAAVGAYASYRFWKWLQTWGVGRNVNLEVAVNASERSLVRSGAGHGWAQALAAGLWLGLAQLTKLTLLVLVPIWLMLGVARVTGGRGGRITMSLQLAGMFVIALLAINVGYGFRDSFLPLGEYRFASSLFSGKAVESIVRRPDDPLAEQEPSVRLVAGNRWAKSRLARVPVPLPRDYVMGIDCQRGDFEVGGRSYFGGKWNDRGWWWYQPVGRAIKTPVGTLVLVALAGAALVMGLAGGSGLPGGVRSRCEHAVKISPRSWCDEMCLLLPVAGVFALLCTQTGFSNHVRYALPATPYLAIFAGRLGAGDMGRMWRHVCWGLIVATGIEAATVYPHGISFFNVLVGGPARGHEWLLDSNVACGQDLLYLRAWQQARPEARPLHLATASGVNPAQLGIEYVVPPIGPLEAVGGPEHLARLLREARAVMGEAPQGAEGLGPQAGWYVIDVNHLHGTAWGVSRPEGTRQRLCTRGLNYEYFRYLQPCGRIAYSYLVYHVTAEEAAVLRRKLGLE